MLNQHPVKKAAVQTEDAPLLPLQLAVEAEISSEFRLDIWLATSSFPVF